MPRLNKSHLRFLLPLIYLIIFTLANYSKPPELGSIEVEVKPNLPSVGDTIVVKIQKLKNEQRLPKVFFDQTKLPVFDIGESWYRSLIPISANFTPGKHLLEVFYIGQGKKIDLTIKDTKYPLQELTLTKEVAALRATKIERALVAKALSVQSTKKFWSGKFILPTSAPQSTLYGVKRRINGIIDPEYFHKGLDFAASLGTSVKAPEDGKVILAGYGSKGFVVNGNCIFLDHGHGVISGYLHLSKVLVKEGDFVKKGQPIGKVGSTGIASGPHLHWGLYVLGKTVDPLAWTRMIIE